MHKTDSMMQLRVELNVIFIDKKLIISKVGQNYPERRSVKMDNPPKKMDNYLAKVGGQEINLYITLIL